MHDIFFHNLNDEEARQLSEYLAFLNTLSNEPFIKNQREDIEQFILTLGNPDFIISLNDDLIKLYRQSEHRNFSLLYKDYMELIYLSYLGYGLEEELPCLSDMDDFIDIHAPHLFWLHQLDQKFKELKSQIKPSHQFLLLQYLYLLFDKEIDFKELLIIYQIKENRLINLSLTDYIDWYIRSRDKFDNPHTERHRHKLIHSYIDFFHHYKKTEKAYEMAIKKHRVHPYHAMKLKPDIIKGF